MMKTVVVDHINPIVDMYGFEDWNSFIDRAFPQDKEGPVFQAICRICHDKKIAEERGERNERKRDRREAAKASSKASP